jgi:hypothetical protein
MILPLVLFLTTPVLAQYDFSAIQELDQALPNYSEHKRADEEIDVQRQIRRFQPPNRAISLEEIKESGTQMGAVPAGVRIRDLKSNKDFIVTKLIYVRYFNHEDANGFKYIQNKDGSLRWRILSRYVEPIKHELELYEPPLRYTPAPDNIVSTVYDKKLSFAPEVSFYAGIVQGNYMRDLFDDDEALSGRSNQYGLHLFTQWKLPVKAGAVLHFERTTYHLSNGGQIIYSSPSFGPQFKTKDFELMGHPLRFQTQFRISPFSRATAETVNGLTTFNFNSADLLFSLERPIHNRLGEFVLGFYVQSQWLNIKQQVEAVSVRASNQTNKSFGLSFAQVFE